LNLRFAKPKARAEEAVALLDEMLQEEKKGQVRKEVDDWYTAQRF